MEPNPKMKWIELQTDDALGKVKEPQYAGIISFKMCLYDLAVKNETEFSFSSFDAWKKNPMRRLDTRKIRAYIFQCRDLPAADSDG